MHSPPRIEHALHARERHPHDLREQLSAALATLGFAGNNVLKLKYRRLECGQGATDGRAKLEAAAETIRGALRGGGATRDLHGGDGEFTWYKLNEWMQLELDLPEEIVRDLLSCSGTDIVVIADDSSSMNTVCDTTNISKPITRWGELRNTLEQLVHRGQQRRARRRVEWHELEE